MRTDDGVVVKRLAIEGQTWFLESSHPDWAPAIGAGVHGINIGAEKLRYPPVRLRRFARCVAVDEDGHGKWRREFSSWKEAREMAVGKLTLDVSDRARVRWPSDDVDDTTITRFVELLNAATEQTGVALWCNCYGVFEAGRRPRESGVWVWERDGSHLVVSYVRPDAAARLVKKRR